MYYKAGRYDEAVLLYNESLTTNPESKEIWLKIAKTFESLGSFDEAADAYTKGGVEILGEETAAQNLTNSSAFTDELNLSSAENITETEGNLT